MGGNRRVERKVFRVFVITKGRGRFFEGKPGVLKNDSTPEEVSKDLIIRSSGRGDNPRDTFTPNRGCLRAH